MALPSQVAAQAERANQLHAQAYSTKDPEAQPPVEAPEPAESNTTPAVEPQVEAQPPEAAPVDPAAAPEPAKPTAPAEDFEQKYRTLQGVMRAESGKWQAEKKVMEERLRALEQAHVQPPAQAPAKPEAAKLVTQQDLDTYGPELIDVIGRKAQEIADQIVAKRLEELKPELDKTKQQVTQVAGQVYQNVQERFYGELTKEVPDWQTVNADQRWLDWLAETDPLSGVPRQVYLDNAAKTHDHVRAARLFSAFKDAAGLNKAPAPEAPPAPAKPALSPTPRTVGTNSAPTPREPETGFAKSQIAAHYGRASRDAAYRNSPEYQATEQRIAQAMASGQIIEA